MVSVEQAYDTILQNLITLSDERVPIEEATGRVLAEEVLADRAFPPFNRVAMDGIAINHDAFAFGERRFRIADIAPAGEPQRVLNDTSSCVEVMTGAVLPAGTDTVIRYEDLKMKDATAEILLDNISPGSNVHHLGSDVKPNEVILEPGVKLTSAEIAVLASVGKSSVLVKRLPRVAVLSAGDELIPIDVTPQPHQIRQSNSYALEAAFREYGCSVKRVHVRDDKVILKTIIAELIVEHDVLVLSGGISKGKFDFIPSALEENGVHKLFQEVRQRPGKPLWFGVKPNECVVFALPGNPVSTFMCFYKYIRPWLLASLGLNLSNCSAVLASDYTFAPPVTLFLQVNVTNVNGTLQAVPVPGGGSGDFANLKDVTGFLELPSERDVFEKGEIFNYISFR